jgi:putative endonuclease
MARDRAYFVYIMSSVSGVLYTGSTSDLARPAYQHRHGLIPGFTRHYNVNRLVWYDVTPNARAAVAMERETKRWRREKKVGLIEATNPGWQDLSLDWTPSAHKADPSLRSG